MGTYEDMYSAVEESVEHLLPAFALDDARQQCHPQVHILKECHDCLKMLFCEYLCWGHDTCLVSVVDGDKHRHQRHEGLARANIALQQAVHLAPATHILANLSYHPFLGFCQREG